MLRRLLGLLVLLGPLAIFSSGAHAELLEYSFTTPRGEQRTVAPDVVYANPVGTMTFALSGGVDRKLRVSIQRTDGTVLESATSKLLGANDRISVRGSTYYGAFLSLNAPAEGEYRIIADILGAEDKVVQSDQYQILIDTTPPLIGSHVQREFSPSYPWTSDLLASPHWGGSNTLFSEGVLDAGSGLEKAEVYAIDPQGVRRVIPAMLEANKGVVSVNIAEVVKNSFTPYDRTAYRLGFRVYDRAGNYAENVQVNTRVDKENPSYLGTQIYNPRTGVWENYVSGMTIYENPFRYRHVMERSEHTRFNGQEYGWRQDHYTSHDNSYVYMQGSLSYPQRHHYIVLTNNAGRYTWIRYGELNFTLAPGVELGPVPLERLDYKIKGESWVSDLTILRNTPFTIEQIRFYAEKRSYPQLMTLEGTNVSCVIQANQDNCVANASITQTVGKGYIPYSFHASRTDGSQKTHGGYLYTWWDFNKPTISDLNYDSSSGNITVGVIDHDRLNNNTNNPWDTRDFKIELKSDSTTVVLDNFQLENLSYNTRRATFSTRSAEDGWYSMAAVATDTFGNTVRKAYPDRILIDTTPPALSISSPTKLSSLDEVVISLSDNHDANPVVREVLLVGGPANDELSLSWREESKGTFRLEYPIIFPSLKAGESYSLTVVASDHQRNDAVETVRFEYQPRQVALGDGMDGKIMLPAVAQEFFRANGRNVIETEPFTLSDGSVVRGTYDVLATLRSDADFPVFVNGVRISPGETMNIMGEHDFSNAGGRLSIPVYPAVSGVVGTSSLLVMASAPNSPVLVVDLHTWQASANLAADSWEVRQVLDPVRIQAQPAPGTICRFTSKEDEARAADPIRDPVCLLEWERIPDEVEQLSHEGSGLTTSSLVGQAVQLGKQPVEYSLYLFSGNGAKIKVGQGKRDLAVTSAYGAVAYAPNEGASPVNRVIQDVDMRLRQIRGPECFLSLNAEQVKRDAATRQAASKARTCLLEWQQLPDGLTQDVYSEAPQLDGMLATKGMHRIGWRVSTFSRNGTRITLADETFDIEAVDPPAPAVQLLSQFNLKDNLYMVPMSGAYLGDAEVTAERAELDVSIKRNSSVLENETFAPGWSPTSRVLRRLNTDARALWEETLYTVQAAYTKVPEIQTTSVYRAISVPSYSIRPVIEVSTERVLDTEKLPVKVLIRDQYRPAEGYDPATMGEWRVRLVQQKNYGEVEPLTGFADAVNGEALFHVDVSGQSGSSLRIAAEAELKSPFTEYHRREQSTRPAFFTLLRGGEIHGDVVARRMSGEAPFTSVFKIELHDRLDTRATGDIIWEVSSNGGQTWDKYVPEERYKYQLIRTFEKGTYQVRAKIVNRNSGAAAYTESVEVIAYDKPKIAVTGPVTLFVGSEATYSATATLAGESIPADQLVVEWSTDAGATYTHTGPTIKLSSESEGRVRLWARVRSTLAPGDDRYAYDVYKGSVEFRAVKAPRVKITGPSRLETGKPHTFHAVTTLPYKNMDVQVKGYWTLPDGTRAEGDTVVYVPTEEDLAKQSVETMYTAWVEGFREEGAETSQLFRSRIWQYVWPKFTIQARTTADVAPATVSMSIRPVAFRGTLEEPIYEWSLPQGATVVDERLPTSRSFTLDAPGEYPVKVTVRDARGHTTTLEQVVTLDQAEPYKVDLQYTASNSLEREPLDVRLRPYISGGHPRDRITERIFMLNDELLESTGYYGRATLQAGEHVLKLKVISEMGHEASGEVKISVAENQLPSCSIRIRDTIGSWIVYAECDDPDGRMKSYEWAVGGEVVSISSDRLTISKGRYEEMPQITLVGIDDSGGRSEPVTLH